MPDFFWVLWKILYAITSNFKYKISPFTNLTFLLSYNHKTNNDFEDRYCLIHISKEAVMKKIIMDFSAVIFLVLVIISCSGGPLPKEITVDANPKYFITHAGFEGTDGKVYYSDKIGEKTIFLTPDPENPIEFEPYQICANLDSIRIRKYIVSHSPVKLDKSQVYLIDKLIFSAAPTPQGSGETQQSN